MGRNTISLENFSDFSGEVQGVAIEARLPLEPYIPSGDIHINVNRIAVAARIGHLGSVTFRRFTEATRYATPDIAGMHDDGSATAATAVASAATERANFSVDAERLIMSSKGNALVNINFGHEDVEDMRLHEADAWAKYLDAGIRQGLYGAAKDKLTKDPLRRLQAFGGTSLLTASASASSPEAGAVMYGAVASLDVGLMAYMSARLNRRKGPGHGPELSLLPGLPLDRLALAKGYSHTRRFVKAS